MKASGLLCCLLLLVSCGSIKKTTEEGISQTLNKASSITEERLADVNAFSAQSVIAEESTSEQTSDSAETMTIYETTWYDTGKADSKGFSPVLKTEKRTSITYHGKHTVKGSDNKESSEEKRQSSTNIQNSAKSEEAAESENKSQTKGDASVTETKQLQYISWGLPGLALVIIAAVLAYWVFTKYRQQKNLPNPEITSTPDQYE